MTVWPSIAAFPFGRWLGRLYDIKWPNLYICRLGNLFAVASIPAAVLLYFYRLLPSFFGLPLHGMRYMVTNRRVVELRSEFRGLRFDYSAETKSIPLDAFDAVAVDVREGQSWFDAADLVFSQDNKEVFRLAGVSRAEAFRHVCLKSHRAHVGVKAALEREAALA
jgi:hypothetical protein